MFPLNAFSIDVVSRLTGLSVPQLRRWDRSGFFVPAFADPERRRPYNPVYSFVDVVGLRTIAKLREAGVPLSELKKVRAFFAPPSNEDWANRRFYVVGRRVFCSDKDAATAARPLGSQGTHDVVHVASIVDDVAVAARQLATRTPEEIGRIARNQFIMDGVPVLAGTRIPTATVDWFYRNGYDVDGIIQEFPRLTPEDVAAAVAFERRLRKDGQASARAAG